MKKIKSLLSLLFKYQYDRFALGRSFFKEQWEQLERWERFAHSRSFVKSNESVLIPSIYKKKSDLAKSTEAIQSFGIKREKNDQKHTKICFSERIAHFFIMSESLMLLFLKEIESDLLTVTLL